MGTRLGLVPNDDAGEGKKPISRNLREAVEGVLIGVAFWMEKDTFKLAIRGCSTIEQIVDLGIAEALPRGVPKELAHLTFRIRLALAESLGLITPETRRLVGELRIRNAFAHGKIAELELARARALIQPAREVFGIPPLSAETEETPHLILTGALITAALAARTSIASAAEDRLRREAALEAAVRSTPATTTLSRRLDEARRTTEEP